MERKYIAVKNFSVPELGGKSKGPEEPKSKCTGKPSANRHSQIKICKTKDELNRFLANRPDIDIVFVTPLVMSTGYYANIFFQVVYRAKSM